MLLGVMQVYLSSYFHLQFLIEMFYRMGVRYLWQDVISRQNAGTWDLTNLFKYFYFVMSIDCMESESKFFLGCCS